MAKTKQNGGFISNLALSSTTSAHFQINPTDVQVAPVAAPVLLIGDTTLHNLVARKDDKHKFDDHEDADPPVIIYVGPPVPSRDNVYVLENSTGPAYTPTQTDIKGHKKITWSLSGADASLFSINAQTGVVSFLSPPNAEAWNHNNGSDLYWTSYNLDLIASRGTKVMLSRPITISVTGVDEAPIIVSGNSATVAENSTDIVYTALVENPDRHPFSLSTSPTDFSYSLTGADAAKFQIDSNGRVSFIASPDYENPLDANGDNIYDITVIATDINGTIVNGVWVPALGLSSEKAVTITVTDVANEPVVVDPHCYIQGTDGSDVLFGNSCDDVINGGGGNDAIFGQDGSDLLNGDNGDDQIYGGSGSDVVNGGAGNDILYNTGNGDDSTIPGNDLLTGGEGNDSFVFFSYTLDSHNIAEIQDFTSGIDKYY